MNDVMDKAFELKEAARKARIREYYQWINSVKTGSMYADPDTGKPVFAREPGYAYSKWPLTVEEGDAIWTGFDKQLEWIPQLFHRYTLPNVEDLRIVATNQIHGADISVQSDNGFTGIEAMFDKDIVSPLEHISQLPGKGDTAEAIRSYAADVKEVRGEQKMVARLLAAGAMDAYLFYKASQDNVRRIATETTSILDAVGTGFETVKVNLNLVVGVATIVAGLATSGVSAAATAAAGGVAAAMGVEPKDNKVTLPNKKQVSLGGLTVNQVLNSLKEAMDHEERDLTDAEDKLRDQMLGIHEYMLRNPERFVAKETGIGQMKSGPSANSEFRL